MYIQSEMHTFSVQFVFVKFGGNKTVEYKGQLCPILFRCVYWGQQISVSTCYLQSLMLPIFDDSTADVPVG